MDALAALLLFLTTAAIVAFTGIKLWVGPKAAIERITRSQPEGAAGGFRPASAFRRLIEKLGDTVPGKPKGSRALERQLVRAGFRQPGAVRFYAGSRIALAFVLPLVLLPLLATAQMEIDRKGMLLLMSAVAGYSAPSRFLLLCTRRRQKRIGRSLPDALDLLVVCVESGLGLDQAIMQAARELERSRPEISQELAVTNYEMRGGKRRAEALRDMANRTGVEGLSKLVTVLIQADKFGTSVAQTLRAQSEYTRTRARQVAEEKAAKLGVKLVFPIFFCILPSLFVVTVGPVIAKVVRELLPALNAM